MGTALLFTMLARVAPHAVAFNAAISACEKCSQWPSALCLFSEMAAASASPTVISFNATMTSCENASLWQESVHLGANSTPWCLYESHVVLILVLWSQRFTTIATTGLFTTVHCHWYCSEHCYWNFICIPGSKYPNCRIAVAKHHPQHSTQNPTLWAFEP